MKNGDMVFDRGGELVHAIFGFCDIRNFTDCTEVRVCPRFLIGKEFLLLVADTRKRQVLRADIVNLVNAVAR